MPFINEFTPPEDKKGYGRSGLQEVRSINATCGPRNQRSKTPALTTHSRRPQQ